MIIIINRAQLNSELMFLFCRNKTINKIVAKHKSKKRAELSLSPEQSLKGEKNPDERRQLVAMAAEKWPTRVAKMAKHIDKVLNSSPSYAEAADKEQLKTDMLFFYFGNGFKPEEYVCYELHQKTREECRSFVSFRECANMFRHMNSYSGMQVLNNKEKTYKRLKPYFQRDAVYVSKRKDYPAFQAFIEKHPTFGKKAVFESCGQGVELMYI